MPEASRETSSRARGGAWANGGDAPVGLNATEGWTTTTTTAAAAARSRARASVEAVEIELERATVALERLEASQVALEEASRGGGDIAYEDARAENAEVISTLQARVYELTRALWEQKGWCDGCAGEEAVKEGTWV